jgi:hypothetical protein
VDPEQLLSHLDGVSQQVIDLLHTIPRPDVIPLSLIESMTPENLNRVRSSWSQLVKSGWVAKSGLSEQVRWIQANANLHREYSAEEVAGALSDLGIFWPASFCNPASNEYGQMLSQEQCQKLVSVPELWLPEAPWSIYRPRIHKIVDSVTLPASCGGAFFGCRGTSMTTFSSHLQHYGSKTKVMSPPKVHLSAKQPQGRNAPGVVEMRLTWMRWEKKQDAVTAARKVEILMSELVRSLRIHIGQIYEQHLTRCGTRREERAARQEKVGKMYHEILEAKRTEKKQCGIDGARRGLQLPPAGISSEFGAVRPNRKEVAQQRRRTAMIEKRKQLLKACDEVDVTQPLYMQRFARKKGSRLSGPTHRLLQHLQTCHGALAEEALEKLDASKLAANRSGLKQRDQQSSRQQRRLKASRFNPKEWLDVELA